LKPEIIEQRATLSTKRRWRASQMLLDGATEQEVADELGVTRQDVTAIRASLNKQWKRDVNGDWQRRLAKELARLHQLEHEATEAWKRSKRPTMLRRQVLALKPVQREADLFGEVETVEELVVVQEQRETKGQSGNPAFLAEAIKCVETRLRVMGAFKDVNLNLNMISPDQMLAFSRAFLDAAREVVTDVEMLSRIQERTLQLLPGGGSVDHATIVMGQEGEQELEPVETVEQVMSEVEV
jgi:hypothetical protein